MADPFGRAFAIVIGEEGGFSDEPEDPGNWTSGTVGEGILRGTKFGVSAAAYPAVDIGSLTLADAQAIYRRDYWQRIAGDALAPRLALLVFDAAVNNGVERAVRWLQVAAGSEVDGELGPHTLRQVNAASNPAELDRLCAEFQARRLDFMAGLSTWRSFGLGWSRRLCTLPYQSLTMGDA
jgi:lysozyme family protein